MVPSLAVAALLFLAQVSSADGLTRPLTEEEFTAYIEWIGVVEGHREIHIATRFEFDEEKTLYNWFGDIHPILGWALFIEAHDLQGESLELRGADFRKPKLMTKPHTVTSSSYEHVLPLRLLAPEGVSPDERFCFRFRLKYDTSQLSVPGNLSILTLTSNWLQVCTK